MITLTTTAGSELQKAFAAYCYNRINLISEDPTTLCHFFDSFEHGSKEFFINIVRNLPEKHIYKRDNIIYLV